MRRLAIYGMKIPMSSCATPWRSDAVKTPSAQSLSVREAAVDEDALAVDVGGEVAGEEQRDVRHLLGLSEPTRRNRLQKHRSELFGLRPLTER